MMEKHGSEHGSAPTLNLFVNVPVPKSRSSEISISSYSIGAPGVDRRRVMHAI